VRIARLAVEERQNGGEMPADFGTALGQGGKAPLDDFFLALAFDDALRAGLRLGRQIAHRREDALVLQQVRRIRAKCRRQLIEVVAEDLAPGAGSNGQAVFVVMDGEDAGLVAQPDLTRFEDLAVGIAEQRQQHAIAQAGPRRGLPGNVEIIGIG